MKFGLRKPSLNKKLAARTSVKRIVRHNLGIKAPRGMGIFINPKKAIYNKIYNKTTTRGCMLILIQIPFLLIIIFLILK
ncbi:hypothetical protein [Elizabethkingia anophelis]|uniref:hypothetical protein n=1 Tax=Elizabethkingia anophelis TaxID=1117645 RepID=UPI00301E4D43